MSAERIPGILIALCVAAVLPLIGYYFTQAWPVMDDLGRAALGEQRGVLASIASEYGGFLGRWSGVGLSYAISAAVDLYRWYPVLLLGMAALTPVAAYAALRLLLGAGVRRRTCAAMAVVFFVLFWLGIASPAESVFWMTGALEYSLHLPLGILLLVALCRVPHHWSLACRLAAALSLGCAAIFIAGLHELAAGMLLIALCAGTAVAWRSGRGDRLVWGVVTSMHLAGTLLVLLAPGYENRYEVFPQGRDAGRAVVVFGEQLLEAARWAVDPRLLAATALFVLAPAVRRARPPWTGWPGSPLRWVVPCTWLAALLAGFGAASWAIGEALPLRVLNMLYLVFLSGWFATAFTLGRDLAGGAAPRAGARIVAAVVFVACSGLPWAVLQRPDPYVESAPPSGLARLLQSNATIAVHDLALVEPFRLAMRANVEQLRQAAAQGHQLAVLPPVTAVPRLLHWPEIWPDPKMPNNKAFGRYFGVPVVRGPDPAAGEFFLSREVPATLQYLGPLTADGTPGTLFEASLDQSFRLRPPPPELGRTSTARIWYLDFYARQREPAGVRAEVFLRSQAAAVSVVAEIELRSAADEVVARTERTVAETGRWIPVELLAPAGATFREIRFGSRMPREGDDNRRVWSKYRNVQLVWRRDGSG